MTRTVPVSATQTAGNLITAALWNAGPAASNTFLTTVPVARLRQTISQNYTTGTQAAVSFDSSDEDSDGGHSNTVNNSRYTFQVAGLYLLVGQWSIGANTTGFRRVAFNVNGATDSGGKVQYAPSPNFETVLNVVDLLQFSIGDYVELDGWQGSGSTLSTVVGSNSTDSQMKIYWVRT